jgi:hypothetical protein
MLIGITGTDGAGKGEKVRGTFARPCQLVIELEKITSDKVYCACKQFFFYCTHELFVYKYPNMSFVCKSKAPAPDKIFTSIKVGVVC